MQPTIPAPGLAEPQIDVARWPSERPLLICVILASLLLWGFLILTIFGVVYALFIAAFLFFAHLVFITSVRGSAVRLGPEQFPELHARVVELSRRAGLRETPAAYLMESGGALNALATKFFRSRMIVLFSDLLDACGDDHAARDMVIGHEIGHLRSGHLDWMLLLAPGRLLPFLGSAYSRACELTCDRWGAALCGDPTGGERTGAVRGLAILAAGRSFARQLNLRAFVEQQRDLDTGWMTLGRWLSSYPPLSARVAAIQPTYAEGLARSLRGPRRALAIVAAIALLPTALGVGGAVLWWKMMKPIMDLAAAQQAGAQEIEEPATSVIEDVEATRARAESELMLIAMAIHAHHESTGELPGEDADLEAIWQQKWGDAPYPTDPFDGASYGYYPYDETSATLFSSGPDAEVGTADDVQYEIDVTPSDMATTQEG